MSKEDNSNINTLEIVDLMVKGPERNVKTIIDSKGDTVQIEERVKFKAYKY